MCAQAQKYVHEINSAPTCYTVCTALRDTHADTFALFPERKPRISSTRSTGCVLEAELVLGPASS